MFQMAKNKTTKAVDFPIDLYDRFSNSKFRKQFNTDGEAIRAAIIKILDAENITQVNNESQA